MSETTQIKKPSVTILLGSTFLPSLSWRTFESLRAALSATQQSSKFL